MKIIERKAYTAFGETGRHQHILLTFLVQEEQHPSIQL